MLSRNQELVLAKADFVFGQSDYPFVRLLSKYMFSSFTKGAHRACVSTSSAVNKKVEHSVT